MTRRVVLQLVFAVAALAAGREIADARQTPARQAASDLSRELMSPFCPGKLLADCTSPNAGELRDAIAARLAAGEGVAAVKSDLVRQYGKEILGAPPAEGVGWLAWLVPGLLGLVSAAGLAWKVAQAVRGSVATPAVAAAGGVDAAAFAQLDDELRDLD